ncbi:AIPR family protein [Pseudomonas sp. MDMC216]|uniref:AIPR protein n=1 Tax=Ectopseudomonas chengduensis TaxID=489632 RepID=A0A1G6SRK7_9GAMM|nr:MULTISPECIES: AIPR family protein [Pseudomonas]MBA4683219.1 AIPR family protein [Pseudomonas sp.]MBP3063032.1 abortive phage resistance protein [Pseudomonas chengduensis]MDH0958288.1 AIPR family protein [Pseudomonas chengduensis]MDH1538972.1 AIPR family protein [Pseudomonas chengduensis]MDI5992785.1 AIPR family protein [Pseudomonas sp. MDMC216]
MARNDTILIDSLLQQMQEKTPGDIGDIFERFALDQILKSYDLSTEEIDFGWTDGSLDGGIDGFYILINGRLLTDSTDFSWPRSGAEIQVYIITCKHHETFQQSPLDSLLATTQDIFDLSLTNSELSGKYSAKIKQCRDLFVTAFKQLSLLRPTIVFDIVYASRGNVDLLGTSIKARANQLTSLLNSYFSASTSTFTALGSAELVERYRQVRSFALDLPVQECLTAGQEGYVVLAKLKDYSAFVQDEKGNLRRYLFDSNVRAYLGVNLVNADIHNTLNDISAPNFWWLNNGVTILATSASIVGKTLKLRDIQIVNGLQTTESIYKHYTSSSKLESDSRTLLVKVIVSQDESIRDQVIRATNNQSSVEPAALHATEKIQRSIEEILIRHDWFYERRTNFYKNEGKPENRILSPLTIAAASTALLLKNPVRSSKLRQKHLRTTEAYQSVYSESFPMNAWPVIAALIRYSELSIIKAQKSKRGPYSGILSAWRGVLAYIAAVRSIGTYSYQHRDLISMDLSKVTEKFMDECWAVISQTTGRKKSARLTDAMMLSIANAAAIAWGIKGDWTDGRREIQRPIKNIEPDYTESEDFLTSVHNLLPPQPWKPGVHMIVAEKLDAKPLRVSRAIKTLIKRGALMEQVDGVVFDANGNEVFRDLDR